MKQQPDNRTFYVKYDNSVVGIDTHFTTSCQSRDKPLSTVGNLIAACFPSAEPLALAQYTIHIKTIDKDGSAIELPPNCQFKNVDISYPSLSPPLRIDYPLSALGSMGTSVDYPLVLGKALFDLTYAFNHHKQTQSLSRIISLKDKSK